MSVCHFPSSSVAQATNVKHMRDFWREQGIKGFFPHAGPVSEVLGVQGYIVPDIIVVGTDSHVVTDGAFGAFATVIESTDMGAKVGFIAADGKTLKYIKERTNKTFEALQPDKDTQYERVVSIDVSGLEPMIACRPNPGNVRLLPEVVPVKVDQAFIGTCTGGRMEDMREAAWVRESKFSGPYGKSQRQHLPRLSGDRSRFSH